MPKRKVRAWGFQKSGEHPFWSKVEAWLGGNKGAKRKPGEWKELAAAWRMAPTTLSDWKDAGQLPKVDQCLWLSVRMAASLADLLDPSIRLGESRSDDQTIRDFFGALPAAVRSAIARAIRANPKAAVGVLAGLDPSSSLPG